jgi:hypothetical protein
MQMFSILKAKPATAALNLQSTPAGISRKFSFTTREEYIAYRSLWKAAYFQTIREIRQFAVARREAERAFSKAGPYDHGWKSADPALGTYRAATRELGAVRRKHRELKAQATEQLADRAQSKVEAGRQRALRLAAVR